MREDIPHHIGRYDVIALLGEGGMARAYLAVSRGPAGFNKLAVIKQILPSLASDADFIAMFLDEARLAARLHHPNIVQTFDASEQDGSYVLAMEYLEGQALSSIYRQVHPKTIPLETHLWILTQVLTGLHYAHTLCDYDGTPLGVVHRDVSPGNVLVTYSGEVKLLDFGVAKARCAIASATDKAIKGKPGYCAPEQFRTIELDARADVFAVGVMLWEALAGRRFNRGATLAEVAKTRLLGTEPKIRDVKPDVDPVLADICDRALALNPAHRFSTAADFQMALQSQLRKLGGQGPSTLVEMLDKTFSTARQEVRRLIEKRLVAPSVEIKVPVTDPQGRSVAAPGVNPKPTMAARLAKRFVPAAVVLVCFFAVGTCALWIFGRSKVVGKTPSFISSSPPAARAVVDPLPAPVALPVAEATPSEPSQPLAASTAEVQTPADTTRAATLRKIRPRQHRGSFTVAATARQSPSLPSGAIQPSPVAESPTPRAATQREASPMESQGAVDPGTHLLRPAGKSARGSIDERDPYGP